ncbi:hypothetical protein PITC_039870 [Penicillium italicum]|uniref:Uncharacterized protein n=1 Tax=Penicillium italicum TaxID=40296 RepID=A0A0A2L7G1_PENIT|nr:hypothetical protein PITC_039870 [Penicillium italicum]
MIRPVRIKLYSALACVADTFRRYAATQSLQLKAGFLRQCVTACKYTCYSHLIQSFGQGGPRTTVHARLSPGWIWNQAVSTEMHPRGG